MTDIEIICAWMEPRPYSRTRSRDSEDGWWRLVGFDRKSAKWGPVQDWLITLTLLRKAEVRLSDGQCSIYDRELYHAILHSKPKPRNLYVWHATVEQKIKALAEVLRASVEGKE